MSENISLGFTINPGRGFTLTFDAYQIDVEDRIAVTTTFTPVDTRLSADGVTTIGAQIQKILVANNVSPDISGQYYINAIDTRTQGLDLVATYRWGTDNLGDFDLSAGFNYNETEITGIIDNPSELASLGNIVIFDRSKQGALTDALPKTKLSLNLNWQRGPISANLRGTRFDEYWTRNATNPAQDRKIEADFITDVQVNYDLTDHFRLTAGVNNLFNVYPTRIQEPSAELGTGMYSGLSPFGFTGGSWFVRGIYKW